MTTTMTLQDTARAYLADRRRGYEYDRRQAGDRRNAARLMAAAKDHGDRRRGDRRES